MGKTIKRFTLIILLTLSSRSICMLNQYQGRRWKPWVTLSLATFALGINTYCIGRNAAVHFGAPNDVGPICNAAPGTYQENTILHAVIEVILARVVVEIMDIMT